MSTVAAGGDAVRTSVLARVRALPTWASVAIGLTVLAGASVWLRTTAIHAPFWIDEGLSVGIASFPFTEIPTVLRQDGSPPLYYLLLHVWMEVFGNGQATTHMLSLVFAILCIPAALWAAWSLFGPRAGVYAALLTTVNPFLTYYAQETRMYALVALLSFLVAGSLAHVFVWRRRAYLPLFVLSTAALIYTHNWGLFLAAGSVVAVALCVRAASDRRAVLRDGVLGYGLVGLLYLPWVPSLLFQAAHTGAPWSERPSLPDVLEPITRLLGGETVPLALLLVGGAGLAVITREPARPGDPGLAAHPRRLAVRALIALPLAGLALAWTASQVSPAWAGRYFAVFVGPVLVLGAIGLAHAWRMGLIALSIFVLLWIDPLTDSIESKSNVRLVAAKIKNDVMAGDLVVSVHPEQIAVLHYYFPDGLRWATALGPTDEPRLLDWRDVLDRLKAAGPKRTLAPMVDSLRPGQTLVLTLPIIRTGRWGAPWTELVRRRSDQWERAANSHPELIRLGPQPNYTNRALPRGVRVVLYRKASVPPARVSSR